MAQLHRLPLDVNDQFPLRHAHGSNSTGLWGAGAVMRFLGIRRSELDRRRAANSVLALWGEWRWGYPARQFTNVDGCGDVLDGLSAVLETLVPVIDAVPTARWLAAPCDWLDGMTPWDVLAAPDDRSSVLEAARRAASRSIAPTCEVATDPSSTRTAHDVVVAAGGLTICSNGNASS